LQQCSVAQIIKVQADDLIGSVRAYVWVKVHYRPTSLTQCGVLPSAQGVLQFLAELDMIVCFCHKMFKSRFLI
jgi:hypothetical protein